MDLAGEAGNTEVETDALIGLAALHLHAGQLDEADAHAHRALRVALDSHYRMLEGNTRSLLAAIQLAHGRPEDAIDQARQALASHTETGHLLGQARTHLILSHALHHAGHDREAPTHHTAAQTLFAQIGTPPAEHRKMLAMNPLDL